VRLLARLRLALAQVRPQRLGKPRLFVRIAHGGAINPCASG
jgi:hypothetical protein